MGRAPGRFARVVMEDEAAHLKPRLKEGRGREENRLRGLKNEHTERNLHHDVRTFPRAHGRLGL